MPPTTYHLRNESGIEVFTGTIVPAPSGGSQPCRAISLAFAFNTPNLLTGVPLFTPVAGDQALPYIGYISNPATWDGTTPTMHIGVAGDLNAYDASFGNLNTLYGAQNSAVGAHGATPAASNFPGNALIFDDAEPVIFSVDDGSGGDPGSMMGAALLWFMVGAA